MGKYDYNRINFTAQKLLVEKCNVSFPVNILELVSLIPNIHISTYKEFNESISIKFGKKAEQISNEAFSCKMSESSYLIFYNDDTSIKLPQRIRFSLAHELGHILLGHFDSYNGFLPRNGFGVANSLIEGEADIFAGEVLCPTCLTDPVWTQKIVEQFFDVSSSVAKITIDNKRKYPWIKSHYAFKDYFSKFTANPRKDYFGERARNSSNYSSLEIILNGHVKYYHYCSNCKSLDINYGYQLNYCTICGSNELEIVTHDNYFQFHETTEQLVEFYIQGDNENMKYKALALDDEGRLTEECPNCKNEDLKGNYCSICGKDIINKCSGLREGEEEWQYKRCDNLLSGADRYCYDCGATSTFLDNGFLPSWDKTPEDLPF